MLILFVSLAEMEVWPPGTFLLPQSKLPPFQSFGVVRYTIKFPKKTINLILHSLVVYFQGGGIIGENFPFRNNWLGLKNKNSLANNLKQLT